MGLFKKINNVASIVQRSYGDNSPNINMSGTSSTSVTINGKTYSGNSVRVFNDTVYVDGKKVSGDHIPKNILTIEVKGTLGELKTDKSVSCDNIQGSVIAGGSVNCDNIGGNVNAYGSVNCDDISGSVTAGGSINRG